MNHDSVKRRDTPRFLDDNRLRQMPRIVSLVVVLTLVAACDLDARNADETASSSSWDTDSAMAQGLTELNTRITTAYEEGDVAFLRSILSDQHIHNNVFGSRLAKDEFLNDIESGELEFVSYETPELEWYISPDMAVATGVIEAQAKRGGKPVPATTFAFTRVFAKEGDGWKVLLFHNTMRPQSRPG